MANLLSTSSLTPIPAELDELAREHAGEGVSFKREDQLTPIITLYQNGSPQVDKRGDDYNGGEPGDFGFRGALNPIVKGETGFLAIFCGMQRVWMEWKIGRVGFADRHDKLPNDIELRMIQQDGREKQALVRPNGNVVEDTRELYLLVDGAPYVLPCTSTKHTFARRWQTHFQQLRHPQTGKVLPSFMFHYRLTSAPESNPLGRWFGLRFAQEAAVSIDEFKAACLLADDVERGARRAELPLNDDSETAGRVLRSPAA